MSIFRVPRIGTGTIEDPWRPDIPFAQTVDTMRPGWSFTVIDATTFEVDAPDVTPEELDEVEGAGGAIISVADEAI